MRLPLRITFVGEPAADEEGPKREFFRLAIKAFMNDPSLFTGCYKVPLNNTTALLQNHFKYVGYIVAMTLVQGIPGPVCFASWVYEYLARG